MTALSVLEQAALQEACARLRAVYWAARKVLQYDRVGKERMLSTALCSGILEARTVAVLRETNALSLALLVTMGDNHHQ